MIYVSTGGFRNLSLKESVLKLSSHGIKRIELSGGKYLNVIKIKTFLKKNKEINFCFHNYFPVPKKKFVINLATANTKIYNQTFANIKKSIDISSEINSKFFSFHVGFLFDPNPNYLGKTFSRLRLDNKSEAMKRFIERSNCIAKYAKTKNIKILIENNVITKNNLKSFGCNPFLLSSPDEIYHFFKNANKNIGLLLDVGHLKVSSNSLGFNLIKGHDKIKPFIEGYHLSDNDGKRDSNSSFSKNSWFFKNLKLNLNFVSIEVYTKNVNKLKKLYTLIKHIYDK
jgi:sugar phosphate isomerase/epimerase